MREKLTYVFPEHFTFLFGEVALYSFVVLVATGIFLALFYVPSETRVLYEGAYAPLRGLRVSEAFASVVELSFGVRAGLLMRQTHHWAALVFLGAIFAHLARVFFTGAFRRPRELNWMTGVVLLLVAMLEGFAGYSLLDDLLSGQGLRIGYSVAQSIPVVGSWAAFLIFGGEYPGEGFLARLFAVHVLVMPAVLAGLITVHLALIVRQHHHAVPRRWPHRAQRRRLPHVADVRDDERRPVPDRRGRPAADGAASSRSTRCGCTGRTRCTRTRAARRPTSTCCGYRARCG